MEISYFGHSSFKIKTKGVTLITDPFDSAVVGLKFPTTEANIVTVSHHHDDHAKVGLVRNVEKIIDGPGEYEVGGVTIIGITSYHDKEKGLKRGKNTIYIFEVEDLRLAHLGDLGHELSEKVVEDIGDIDILMIPVGGIYTINSKEASEIVQDIEPSVVIPMHYKVGGLDEEHFKDLEPVDNFLNELGYSVEKSQKLMIKKVDIKEESKVVVLDIKS